MGDLTGSVLCQLITSPMRHVSSPCEHTLEYKTSSDNTISSCPPKYVISVCLSSLHFEDKSVPKGACFLMYDALFVFLAISG